jgi:hypothetical protein
MRKTIFVLILAMVFTFSLMAEEKKDVDTEKEKAAIKETALNYLEGWYEGSAERMDKALHPEVVKRAPFPFPPTGGMILNSASKSNMVEFTKAGFGKEFPKDKLKITVEILDMYKHIATAKTTTPQFIDYIHLVKMDGEWKIINVLWESTQPPQPTPPPPVDEKE